MESNIKTVLFEASDPNNNKQFLKMNDHWRPSNSYCAFCNLNYTAISKTESFDEDKSRILENLSINVEKKYERLNQHGGRNIRNLTKTFFKGVHNVTRAALVELYQYDFTMFDYDSNKY